MKNAAFFLCVICVLCVIFGCDEKAKKDGPGRVTASFKPDIPDNDTAKKQYQEALQKWKAKGIVNYYAKIRYSAFSPKSGIWEVTVAQGAPVKWSFKNKENAPENAGIAKSMTMDSLFEKAAASFQNIPGDQYINSAQYDSDLGYVKKTGKLPNLAVKQRGREDMGFKYEVLEFTQK